MDSSTTVLEAQADWLTASVHSSRKAAVWDSRVKAWLLSEAHDGNRIRPFQLSGYQGEQSGRVRVGYRDGAMLVQLSGDLAARHFDSLYDTHDTLTRLDLAITVQTPTLDDDVGIHAYSQALDWRETHPRAALPTLVQDGNNGSTCYVGQRTSDTYLRIYNKQREAESSESEDEATYYARCWRAELECKGVAAKAYASAYRDAGDRGRWVTGVLHRHCQGHGIQPFWQTDQPPVRVSGLRRRSDYDSRASWLTGTVKPVITWMLQNGDRQDVMLRLGLLDLPGADEGTPRRS